MIIGLYELTECESHRVIEYTALVDATIVSFANFGSPVSIAIIGSVGMADFDQ